MKLADCSEEQPLSFKSVETYVEGRCEGIGRNREEYAKETGSSDRGGKGARHRMSFKQCRSKYSTGRAGSGTGLHP